MSRIDPLRWQIHRGIRQVQTCPCCSPQVKTGGAADIEPATTASDLEGPRSCRRYHIPQTRGKRALTEAVAVVTLWTQCGRCTSWTPCVLSPNQNEQAVVKLKCLPERPVWSSRWPAPSRSYAGLFTWCGRHVAAAGAPAAAGACTPAYLPSRLEGGRSHGAISRGTQEHVDLRVLFPFKIEPLSDSLPVLISIT